MDRNILNQRAGAVAGIFSVVATVVIILGVLGVVAAFIQTIADADEVFVGVMAGILVSLAILVYVVVAWAGIQLFALVAGYIQFRTTQND